MLCIVGHLAASMASTHQTPVLALHLSPSSGNQNPWTLPNVPSGAIPPLSEDCLSGSQEARTVGQAGAGAGAGDA